MPAFEIKNTRVNILKTVFMTDTVTLDKKPFHYNHARPYVAVDCVVFGILPETNRLQVLLHSKTNVETKEKEWVLPGRILHGGTNPNNEFEGAETLTQALLRALTFTMELKLLETKLFEGEEYQEESSQTVSYSLIDPNNVKIQIDGGETWPPDDGSQTPQPSTPTIELTQLLVKSSPYRDTRHRTISVPYMLLTIPNEKIPTCFENSLKWFAIDSLDQYPLGYDHREIICQALDRLGEIVRTQPIGRGLLPESFTINDLGHMYEVILGCTLDRSNLKKLLLQRGVIQSQSLSNRKKTQGGRGQLEYFQFNEEAYVSYRRNRSFGLNPKQASKK